MNRESYSEDIGCFIFVFIIFLAVFSLVSFLELFKFIEPHPNPFLKAVLIITGLICTIYSFIFFLLYFSPKNINKRYFNNVSESVRQKYFTKMKTSITTVKTCDDNIIKNVDEKTKIFLSRDVENTDNSNAIKVLYNATDDKIGYIRRDFADIISNFFDKNAKISVKIDNIRQTKDGTKIIILDLNIINFGSFYCSKKDLQGILEKLSNYNYKTAIHLMDINDFYYYELSKNYLNKIWEKSKYYNDAQNKLQLIKAKQLELDKNNYKQGLREFNNKNWNEAIKFLKRVSKKFGYKKESIIKIQQVIREEQSTSDRNFYQKGINRFDEREYGEAIKYFQKVSSLFRYYQDVQKKIFLIKNLLGGNENFVQDMEKWACPFCKTRMVLTHGWRGYFYSCSNFPDCEYTLDIDAEKQDNYEIDSE